MSFASFIGNIFPPNTVAHKVFDKADSFMNRVVGTVTGSTTSINTGANKSAANSVKQAGIDIIGAYSRNISDSVKNTSTGISQGATGSVVKGSIIQVLLDNWYIVLAAVGLFLLLKKRK